VVSILDDKNASDMLSAISPICDVIVLTASQSPRALPPPTLLSLLEQTGAEVTAEVVSTPHAALERARQLAGPGGVVVATGSIYLIADLASDPATMGARRASML
jgi:dihydrofolate synthase / folylpolyglutamate synthase